MVGLKTRTKGSDIRAAGLNRARMTIYGPSKLGSDNPPISGLNGARIYSS